jgi:L-rhamnose mutarotase
MQRVCFELRVRPERLDEYLRRHDPVWPEMLREIAAAGWRNYSIFSRGEGVMIGYFETDDLSAGQDYLANSEVAARWEADMAPFFVRAEGRADQSLVAFPLIFSLDDQLAAASTSLDTPH